MPRKRKPPAAALARTQRAGSTPCKVCNNLDPRSHAATFHDAEASSRSIARLHLRVDAARLCRRADDDDAAFGCPRCRLLAAALDAHAKEWRAERPRLMLELAEHAPVRLEVGGAGESVTVEIYAPEDKPSPWPTLGRTRSIPRHSDSTDTFDFARRAIEDCVQNHKTRLCGQSCRDEFVPSRLIYVGKSPEAQESIRLCEFTSTKVKYVALSHCWGQGPTFTTTSATLAERKSRIDLRSLPKLFQDAIAITQELGVRYLWVDALCIIQDSKEDWEVESAKMSSVYENAYVTIAATAAPSSECEIFSERPRPVKLKFQASARAKEYKLCARRRPDHHPTIGEDRIPARPDGPLRHRAWALQEHVLCSRILHYTSYELLFECRLCYRCECQPAARLTLTTPRLLPELLITGKKRAYWRTWHRIVAQYTARDLTIPSDKLPAISGIAKKFRDLTGSAYVAGLWKDSLAEDLLWSSDRSSRELQSPHAARRLDAYRAPSFSWASVDTQVQYIEPAHAGDAAAGAIVEESPGEFVSLIKTKEVRVNPCGKNPLGAVDDGWIKLLGPVLEATLIAGPTEKGGAGSTYQLFLSGHSSIDVAPDTLLVVEDDTGKTRSEDEKSPENSIGDKEGVKKRQLMHDKKVVRRALPEETYAPFKAGVLCLGVARYDNSWIAGIVLGELSPTSKRRKRAKDGADFKMQPQYERLGTFSCGNEWFSGAQKKELVIV